jgi:ubiquinol-cytochrome c reductase cytochrome c1 subunit
MPHALWRLQGERVLKEQEALREGKPILGEDGKPRKVVTLVAVSPGTQSVAQYDKTVYDLVNFLTWMGEPNQLARKQIGVWVLFGLAVLILLTYLLKRAYWKDVH